MRLVSINDIPLNEPLSRDLYHSCAELLLPIGTIVDASHIVALQKLEISSVVERDHHETVAEIRRKLLGRMVSIGELGVGDKELRINLYDGRGRFLYRAGTALTDDFIEKLSRLHSGDIYVLQSPDPASVERVKRFAVPMSTDDLATARELDIVRSSLNQLEELDPGELDLVKLNREESISDIVSTIPTFQSKCWQKERHLGHAQITQLRDSARVLTHKIHDSIRRRNEVDTKQLKGAVGRVLLGVIQDTPSSALMCRHEMGDESAYLSSHALNTSTYATLLASEMGLSMAQVSEVASCAYISNVGALLIKDELTTKLKLTVDERQEMRRSSALGIEAFRDFRWLPSAAAHVAYQFRERLDGSGYPRKRKFLHPYARIVGLVDAYDAMTSDRSYRKAILPYFAMETVIHETSRGKFDRQCMKAFLKSLSLFPVGSLVELEGNKVGWVVRSNSDAIDRPVVRVVREGSDNLTQPYIVDTTSSSRVQRPLDPKSFAQLPS